MSSENPVKTILVLSANPKGTNSLRLDKEIREIREGLQLATQRDKFKIESAQAARHRDIRRSILSHKPQIVHFCGHGAGESGLVFEDEILVDAQALAGFFELFADKVECVVLNACYSQIQAKAIAKHINYVIGMSKEIGDKAAIEFAVGFYDALGDGSEFEFAYKYGCSSIRMAGIAEHLTPQLLRKQENSRENIDTTSLITPLPPNSRQTIVVSPPPIQEESNIIEYRQKVEEFASDGVISEIESTILNHLQTKLGLTDEKVRAIQKEVLEPYEIYKQQFNKKVAEQGYPLREKAQAELKKLQDYYKINDEFVNLLNREAEKFQYFETATLDKNLQINRSRGKAEFFKEDLGNGVFLEMVKIPGGSFLMGSPENELERSNDESPQHKVNIQPFFMGKFPVTQEQYQAVMGENPSHFQGDKKPVEYVSWDNAVDFCGRLSHRTGKTYRLPSEAEWEYACRAGTTTPFHFGETITTDLANYDGMYTYGSAPDGKYRKKTTDVGIFPANAFGLYDMHGNVNEWCQDSWHENYQGAPNDGTAWVSDNENNNYRLLRGGSWHDNPVHCRSADRYNNTPDFDNYNHGFRVVVASPRAS